MSSSMKQLSGETVRLITSSQVITSVYSVVKELLENALDANADNIDVKLDNFGFDKIEVRDNGHGITPENATYMAQKHYTSKISNHGDLEDLETYGFRGEALGSLCAVSKVTIATKTEADAVSRLYTLDHHGKIKNSKPSHMGNGTSVTATDLFKNIPVRRQYYSNVKRRKEELKKVEDLLMFYGAVRYDIRVSLSHNKKPVWQKNKTSSQSGSLLNTWGTGVLKQMVEAKKTDAITQISIYACLPKLSSDPQIISRAQGDRCWISVNQRPVTLKELEKVVKQYYCSSAKQIIGSATIRHLVMFMAITMPTNLVDVNLEPNKTKVLLQNTDAVLSLLTDLLQDVYGPLHTKSITEKKDTVTATIDKYNTESTSQESSTDDERIENIYAGHHNKSHEMKTLSNNNSKVIRIKDNAILSNSNGHNGNQCNSDMTSTKEIRPRSEVILTSIEKQVGLEVQSDEDQQKLSKQKSDEDSFLPPLPKFDLTGLLETSSLDLFDSSMNEANEIGSSRNHPPSESVPYKDLDVTIEILSKKDKDNLSDRLAANDANDINITTDFETDNDGGSLQNSLAAKDANALNITTNFVTDNDGGSLPYSLASKDTSDVDIAMETRTTPDRTNLKESGQDSLNGISPSMSDVDWSRGVGLKDQQGHSVGPSVLLVPGKCSSMTSDDTMQLINSTNQTDATSESLRRLTTNLNPDRRELLTNQYSERGEILSNQNSERNNISTNHNAEKDDIDDPMPNPDKPTNQKISPVGRLTNHNKGSPGRCRRPLEQMTGQTTLYDLVGNSTVRKPQQAFAIFSRELRPTVVKDNPHLDLAAIGSLLWEKWEELSEEGREEYIKLGQKDAQRYKEQMKSATSKEVKPEKSRSEGLQLPARKKKKFEKLANQNLIDEMLASQRAKDAKKEKSPRATTSSAAAHVKEVLVQFDLQSVKKNQLVRQAQNRMGDDSQWNLIGQLSSNNLWLALHQQQLVLINQYRIEEALLYYRLMATHILPVIQLDEPVVLKSSMVGGDDNWVSLLCLQSIVTPPNPDRVFIDERLKANGFHIKQSTDTETKDVRLEVTAMATSISYYGIDDLREVLDLIAQGESKLVQCRPLKIANFLKAEAMRMARGLSSNMTQEDIHDILANMEEHLLPDIQTCLHGKPYLHVMHRMPTGE